MMSTKLVRKQIYLQEQQEARLKRLSQVLGISETEIIYRAIERELSINARQSMSGSTDALNHFVQAALERRENGIAVEPYPWNRSDLYEDRERRWLQENDEE